MTDAMTTPSAHRADIDDIDILVGLHGTKPERDTWTRLRTALLTHPRPSLSVGLDREAVADAMKRLAEDAENVAGLGAGMLGGERIAADIKTVLSALAAPADGYVLVPVDPTEAMREAGKVARGWSPAPELHAVAIYRAMIAACLPAAPTGGRS